MFRLYNEAFKALPGCSSKIHKWKKNVTKDLQFSKGSEDLRSYSDISEMYSLQNGH
jgi:hypothetical protein